MHVRIGRISAEIRTGHPPNRTVSLGNARSLCVNIRGKYAVRLTNVKQVYNQQVARNTNIKHCKMFRLLSIAIFRK